MPHRIHRVVGLVAVKRPVAGPVCREFDGAHLPDRNVCGHLRPARSRWNPSTIGACNLEVIAVQMDGVIRHRQVAEADPHTVPSAYRQWVDAREDTRIPRPHVEVGHLIDARREAARVDVIRGHDEHEVTVDLHHTRVLRMDDERAHHPHRHLHHFVGVRVIHKGAVLLKLEFVDERLARRDVRLREATDAIHAGRQQHSVPVNGGVFREFVGHENTDLIAFHCLDGWARRLAVIAPEVRVHARRHFAHYRLGNQVKLLPAVLHAPRQRPAIQRGDGRVGTAIGRREWGLHRGLGHRRRLGQ